MSDAARVLVSMLSGHDAETIHYRRPEWSLAKLRLAEFDLRKIEAAITEMMASVAKPVQKARLRNGERP